MKEILKQQWLAYNHCGPSFGLKQRSSCVQPMKRYIILVSIFWSSWISSRNPAQMWRAGMSSKALRFLDLSFPGKGGSKKKAQNVLISFHGENNMVRLSRYTSGRNVLLRSRHSGGRSWVHVIPWLILTACTCGRGKKGNEYEQGGLMPSLLCSSGAPFCCVPQLRHLLQHEELPGLHHHQVSVGWFCRWFSLEVIAAQKPFIFSELSKFLPSVS